MKTTVMSLHSPFKILNQLTDFYEIQFDVIRVETSLAGYSVSYTWKKHGRPKMGSALAPLDSFIQPHF
jgi:hypothetical protein